MTQKKDTFKWCSRYTRLRDALDFCEKQGFDIGNCIRVEDIPAECCSCGKVASWIKMDAGHYISRGRGGMSGVYYDERNVNIQCKPCNGFQQGNHIGYTKFMLHKYGQKVIDELEVLDKINSYKYQLEGLEIYYKQRYDELVKVFKEGSE